MNHYMAERFQDIADALPSASEETLGDIKGELLHLLEEVEERLRPDSTSEATPPVQAATVHAFNSSGRS